jgi:sigma-B regulation protein RsbU (phosphoserine phosphatase)
MAPVTGLGALLGEPGLEALLSAAMAVAHGGRIAVADPDGAVLAGVSAPDARSLPVRLDDRAVGQVLFAADVPESLAALVRTSIELLLRGSRDQVARARALQELAIGRDIQRSLLPRSFPEVAGWRFAAEYEPAREVSGDLYDVFRVRGEGSVVALLVADVTGKGVPAALLMADAKALLHAATDNADDPAEALVRVNRILTLERRSSLFVTAALAAVDTDTGAVRLAGAGHEPPLLVGTAGTVRPVVADGPILGAFADARFELTEDRVEAGESVVLYTDGITDTRNASGAFYGEPRLRALLAGLGGAPPEDVRRAVLDDVRAFRGAAEVFDDLTILVAQRQK